MLPAVTPVVSVIVQLTRAIINNSRIGLRPVPQLKVMIISIRLMSWMPVTMEYTG